jgi:hypothetical protein
MIVTYIPTRIDETYEHAPKNEQFFSLSLVVIRMGKRQSGPSSKIDFLSIVYRWKQHEKILFLLFNWLLTSL